MGISPSWNGVIFAGYPLGMALTSVVAPQLIERTGCRLAVSLGLSLTAVFTLLFGLVPDLCSSSEAAQLAFFLTYFLNGLTGALAETACIILVSARFPDRLGTVHVYV